MEKKNSLSFKKEPKETGLAGVGYPNPNVYIKLNKKKIGYISAPNWTSSEDVYKIRFSVVKKDILEDGNPNRNWKWITLKASFKSEEKARAHVKKIISLVSSLHEFQEV